MRVAVAGGGIAGLAAALALAERGASVDVFERAPAFEEVGAGIQLSPNAMHVLARLGVAERVRAGLVEPKAIDIRDARSGAALASITLGPAARKRYGAPYVLIHRADLLTALAAAAEEHRGITLHLGAEAADVAESPDGVRLMAGGRTHAADVLVAADGVHSAIRTGHFGHGGAEPTGRVAWRATLPASDVPAAIRQDVTGLWLGPGGHMVHYPLQAGRTFNIVVITAGPAAPAPPLAPFGPAARVLIDAVPRWLPWPLSGVDPSRSWALGRVALVGDAAHAMPPSAAQGGAQAIEDAWVLAASLARGGDPAVALRAYERARRDRVVRIVREAYRNLDVYNLQGYPAAARNIVLRHLPARLLLSRMDWLYGWKPE